MMGDESRDNTTMHEARIDIRKLGQVLQGQQFSPTKVICSKSHVLRVSLYTHLPSEISGNSRSVVIYVMCVMCLLQILLMERDCRCFCSMKMCLSNTIFLPSPDSLPTMSNPAVKDQWPRRACHISWTRVYILGCLIVSRQQALYHLPYYEKLIILLRNFRWKSEQNEN